MSGFLGLLTSLAGFINVTFTAWVVYYQAPAGNNASASITLNSDGTVSRSGVVTFLGANGTQWAVTQTGVGAQVWVKYTTTSGTDPNTGSVGTILSLSAGQTWSMSPALSDKISNFTLDFYADAAGAVLIKTVTGNQLFREHA